MTRSHGHAPRGQRDNLPAHKDPRVRAALHAVGAYLMLLPSYSPDLNPIESAWTKLKAFLRTAKARTVDALNDAIALGCDLITPDDALGWFRHAGYLASVQPR